LHHGRVLRTPRGEPLALRLTPRYDSVTRDIGGEGYKTRRVALTTIGLAMMVSFGSVGVAGARPITAANHVNVGGVWTIKSKQFGCGQLEIERHHQWINIDNADYGTYTGGGKTVHLTWTYRVPGPHSLVAGRLVLIPAASTFGLSE
jgi:hypothetical protein